MTTPANALIVGRGRVGGSLYRYFESKGENQISTRLVSHDAVLDLLRSGERNRPVLNFVFLTVPDDKIAEMGKIIATSLPSGAHPKDAYVFIHTSGLHTSEALTSLGSLGYPTASLHPAVAINSGKAEEALEGCLWTFEGDQRAHRAVLASFPCIGERMATIPASKKTQYHLACVFLSNLVVGLANTGERLLNDTGLTDSQTADLMQTLFLNNAKNIAEQSSANALTGPVLRNDKKTVQAHLEVLKNLQLNDKNENFIEIYKILSQSILEIAKKHKQDIDYSDIIKILDNI
jgi:predicted short-subunit dehydrogenase-like oxidoreductase (DUF2520 family)